MNTNKRLDEIEKNLEEVKDVLNSVNKKISNKWFISVLLVILTALLGTINYIIEKKVDKANITEVQKRMIYTEYQAKKENEFFTDARKKLVNIDILFEAYCNFPDTASENKLDHSLAEFHRFYREQNYIKDDLKQYHEFISESAFTINSENLEKKGRMNLLENSKTLFSQLLTILDKKLREMNL